MNGLDGNRFGEARQTPPPLSVGNTRICIVPGDVSQGARAETEEVLSRIFGAAAALRDRS